MKAATSITHEHLLSIIRTELQHHSDYHHPVKLLDIGCGNGELIAYLLHNLRELEPSLIFEIYGLDVMDHGVQAQGFLQTTLDRLKAEFSDIQWENRIMGITAQDKWPYSDNYFDFIVSNHVLEHVSNHNKFFQEIQRTLSNNGWSAHLFPVNECLYEFHLNLPLAHRILNHDFLVTYIRTLSKMGLGKWRKHNNSKDITLDQYAERHADLLQSYTNYISYQEALLLAKAHNLRGSFRYTPDFYKIKLRSIFGLPRNYLYEQRKIGMLGWLTTTFLKRVSSVTLFLETNETYRNQCSR